VSQEQAVGGEAVNDAAAAVRRRIDALWRIEGAGIVAALARATRDVGFAEDLAQDALAEALVQWPASGTPDNPAAWLTAVAKRKAIDAWRRSERLEERYRAIARDLEDDDGVAWVPLEDDVLRLVFTACHPVLSREAQMAPCGSGASWPGWFPANPRPTGWWP
jgi:predicted RNA polymerase sigma factor